MDIRVIVVGLLCLYLAGCSLDRETDTRQDTDIYVAADSQVEAGRYLVTVGGCNDCHTDGYMALGMQIPESEWLAGSRVGWQGPWGTTYPTNLRLRVQELNEDQWVQMLKSRTGLPPMPWMNVNKLSERDARAIYAYIKSLGARGERMPLAVAPGLEPDTPYLSLMPQNLPVSHSN